MVLDYLRSLRRLVLLVIVIGFAISVLPSLAQAAALNNRSMNVHDTAVSAVTQHDFSFTMPAGVSVGSIRIEYCTEPLPVLACVGPTGLDASSASLLSQSGETGFTMLPPTSNVMILSRPPALTSAGTAVYTFAPVTNPSPLNSFYARIELFPTVDATGPSSDYGAVASTTTRGVHITTEVPPILNFCVAVTIPGDCSTANGSFIELGDLSPAQTASATSQMLIGTNAPFGYTVFVAGTTMTAGTKTIAALGLPSVSQKGSAQFGLNLRANTTPNVGAEPSGVGIATATPNYGSPNHYMFGSGDIIATSAGSTDYNTFTHSYIINIPSNQTGGIYSTTLTYICTGSF